MRIFLDANILFSAAAIRHRCAALVTGDRTHFGKPFGKTIQGTAIHSPRSLAEVLLRTG